MSGDGIGKHLKRYRLRERAIEELLAAVACLMLGLAAVVVFKL